MFASTAAAIVFTAPAHYPNHPTMASFGFHYSPNAGPVYQGNSSSYSGVYSHGGGHGGHPYQHHHHHQPQSSAPSTPLAVCQWGHCSMVLDDLSGPGIKRHLQQFHAADMPPKGTAGQSGGSSRCQWIDETGSCDTECRSAVAHGRHVSTVHLAQGRMECTYCTKTFSRKDALKRHQEQYCPVLQHGPTFGA